MTPEAALTDTVIRAAQAARTYPDDASCAPWLVTCGVLSAQQAAAIALRAVGDGIPQQSGATELLLRAATKDRLPPPYTLPFSLASRRAFERLVEARNAYMHPRGMTWFVSQDTLALGLPVICASIRHLILTQPALADLVSPAEAARIDDSLRDVEALASFLSD